MALLLPEEREFLNEVGAIIRQARLEMKITQEELAARAGMSVTTLLNMEKGRGEGVAFGKWVAVLSLTGYLNVLKECMKEHAYNPFATLENGKPRKRVRRKGGNNITDMPAKTR